MRPEALRVKNRSVLLANAHLMPAIEGAIKQW